MREILFVASDVNYRTMVRDESAPEGGRRKAMELYTEQREIFALFGRIMLERASGTRHRRVSTPPEGIIPLTVAQRIEQERLETLQRFQLIVQLIPRCHLLVVPADAGISDPFAQVIEAALDWRKPVLITKTDPPVLILPSSDRFKGHPGVTYLTHGKLNEYQPKCAFRTQVVRYFQNLPNQAFKADVG
jgi:hypothetical protein